MKPETVITVAGVLFGFLFAGFWWALNRELTFKPEHRHFKPSLLLLLLSMAILAVFGVLVPLVSLSTTQGDLAWPFRAVALAVVGVFGYMLTEMGHYNIFQRPKYSTWQEQFFFYTTLAIMAALCVIWSLF